MLNMADSWDKKMRVGTYEKYSEHRSRSYSKQRLSQEVK